MKLFNYVAFSEGLSSDEREKMLQFIEMVAWTGPLLVASTIGEAPAYWFDCEYSIQELSELVKSKCPVNFRWRSATMDEALLL